MASAGQDAWMLDQLTKSEFFHQKLHEWGVLEIAEQLEQVKGELLKWDLERLGILQSAWDKVIHRGIKPILVFAHPEVMIQLSGAIGYYRMLAMVSQKSMNRVGLNITRFEQRNALPTQDIAWTVAKSLNRVISHLVATDEKIDAREFDLWRGMAAGSQAQGSWQNSKGNRIEVIVKGVLQHRLREKGIVSEESGDGLQMLLSDGRKVIFADEPDVAVYKDEMIICAVEIKGGIDTAGVLERIGAALKSLSRANEENPNSTTILILQGISVTQRAREDLRHNQGIIKRWFMVEEVLENEVRREELFRLLNF